MIIRQSYIDPLSGARKSKDIEITLTETSITARYDSIIAEISPDDKILCLLDSKRTFLPPECNQSRLIKSLGNAIEVENLDVKNNDPLAIIADRTEYFLATSISGNTLTLDRVCNFPAGSLVQNLRNREWKSNYRLGLYSRLCQPHPLPFVVKSAGNQMMVLISEPLNESNIKCWDVYVRKEKSIIERHWLPDIEDSTSREILVSTYGGGSDAGGGKLESGSYYVSVISKDKYGRINVNESVCHWSKIEIP